MIASRERRSDKNIADMEWQPELEPAYVLRRHNLSKREPGSQQEQPKIINRWRLGEPKNLNHGVEVLESHIQNLCQIAIELENRTGQRPKDFSEIACKRDTSGRVGGSAESRTA